MKYTREQLIEKLSDTSIDNSVRRRRGQRNNIRFFEKVYYKISGNYDDDADDDKANKVENECKIVYDQNWGDGRLWQVALYFKEEDIYILLSGYYSSEGESEFDEVTLAEPFEFKETRYRKATIQYLRDKKISKIIDKNE